MGRSASAALAVVLFALLIPGQVLADTASDLKAAERRLNQLEREVASAEGSLSALQSQADALATQVADIESKIVETQRHIDHTEKEIAKTERRLGKLQNRLALRARDVYIKGPGGWLEVIFDSTSIADLSERMALYNAVQRRDADLADQVEAERVKLEGKKFDLGRLKDTQSAQRRDLVARQGELNAKLSAQASIVASLQAKRAEAQGLVKKLKAKKRAEARALAAGGSGPVSGVFRYCPVAGANAFGDDFGAPRYAGGYHPHAGNDIFAAEGTPIVAPFDGYAYISSNGLGGNAVSMDGAAGHTYNAHVSRFGNLGNVSAGTVIAYVGNTGDAQGTPPHDHFEWHPNVIPSNPHVSPYGYSVIGDAIDPYPFLLAACR